MNALRSKNISTLHAARDQFHADRRAESYEKLKADYAKLQAFAEQQNKRIMQQDREIQILRANQVRSARKVGRQWEGFFEYQGREIKLGLYKTKAEAIEAVEKAKEALAE